MASLLSVENLQVQFQTKKGINTAVDGVSFSVEKGRILGIVGESGCGKSVTSMSILQTLFRSSASWKQRPDFWRQHQTGWKRTDRASGERDVQDPRK